MGHAEPLKLWSVRGNCTGYCQALVNWSGALFAGEAVFGQGEEGESARLNDGSTTKGRRG